jgi:hypothetical protein
MGGNVFPKSSEDMNRQTLTEAMATQYYLKNRSFLHLRLILILFNDLPNPSVFVKVLLTTAA